MGASVSTAVTSNTTNDIMNVVTNVLISKASTCTGSSTINTDQSILVNNSTFNKSNIIQAAEVTVDLSCLSSSSTDASLQSEIESQLKQYATTKAEANPTLLNANISTSLSTQIANMSKNLASTIKIDDVKSCIAVTQENLKQSMLLINSTFTDSSLSQLITTSVVQKCVFNDATTTSLVNQLASTIDQSSETTASSGMSTSAIIAIAIIAIIIVAIAIYFLVRKKKENFRLRYIENYQPY
jgi:cobalamin biosynthesis Mg chelatase CobN